MKSLFVCLFNVYFSKISKTSVIQIVTAWQTWNLIMLNEVLMEVCRAVWNSVTRWSYPESLQWKSWILSSITCLELILCVAPSMQLPCVCAVHGFFCKALQPLSSRCFGSATIFASSSPTMLKDTWWFASHLLFQAQVSVTINWEPKLNRGLVKRGWWGAHQLTVRQIWNKGPFRERRVFRH